MDNNILDTQFLRIISRRNTQLADESLVNRNMGNFLIDGYESKSYGLKMINRADWNNRPKLLLFSFFISFIWAVLTALYMSM